ncbi:hypothetical protein IID10_17550 [candidate division KSB1 bacterium]|nr:hypothetical protein [candidate division KSB1 bacterium]
MKGFTPIILVGFYLTLAAGSNFGCGDSSRVMEYSSRVVEHMGKTWPILSVLVIIFLVVLAILWFILPFAIFGIKPLLNKLLAELEETNQYLSELVEEDDMNEESEEIDIEHDATEEESILTDGGKVHFSCDECGTKFTATKEQIGKSGKCNNCGAPIIVPVSD